MQESLNYPVGIQDFEKIRTEGYLYVDKTALMRRLIDTGCYFFLSRPRRFGKSLLLSTFAAYFQGEQQLFKGLDIEKSTEKWPKHPILRLDLGGQRYTKPEDLTEILDTHLNAWEAQYGTTPGARSPAPRFWGLIQRAHEKTGLKAVILVDEYDKPLLDSADNEALYEEYRGILRAFYYNLKSCDGHIKFAFLTGVTKFSKLSVFSDLNNLSDISMLPKYSTICGITEDELSRYFDQGIARLAENNGMTPEQALTALAKHYDGYCFSPHAGAETVYNPFSLLTALRDGILGDYWFESGTPDFLVKMLKRHRIAPENLTTDPIAPSRLNALDSLTESPLPLLYQSGYLTLTGTLTRTGSCYLRFPNEEVEHGFWQQLLPLYAAKDNTKTGSLMDRLVTALEEGRPEDLMRELQALFADIPYEQGKPVEAYFRNLMFIVFRLVGFYCEVEHALAAGRSDMVIKTRDFIYVLEVKVNKSAQTALKQITEKGYAEPYATDPRRLFRIGVNFSTKNKRISKWLIREGMEDAA